MISRSRYRFGSCSGTPAAVAAKSACASRPRRTRPGDEYPFVNLRATMLDNPRWFQPYIETWADEKLPWANTGAARSYGTQPDFDEYESLIGEYQAKGARPA